MKILFVKQLFTPEPSARSLDFATALVAEGHQVQVLTSFPSYPYGKVYDGYKQRLYHKETVEGVDLIHLPIYPDQSKSSLKRIFNYISYLVSVMFIGVFLVRKADVAFAYHGATTVGLAACFIRFFRRIPFVYDINDIWPDTLVATGMLKNKRLLGVVNYCCNFVYKRAAHITVLSHGFKNKLIDRGVPKDKITVIHHWSRDPIYDGQVSDSVKKEYFPSDKINFLFAGNIGAAQSMISVVKAFAKSSDRVNLILLGSGVELENLKKYVNDEKVTNVKFHPRVDSSEVSKYLKSADVLLVHLKNEPLFEITIPSKILAYLKTGKPILIGIKGDAASFIEQSNAGIACIPDDINDIQDKIKLLAEMSKKELTDMGDRAEQFYKENLAIDIATKRYLDVFTSVKKA